MEKTIIKDLFKSYNVEITSEVVSAHLKILNLGFDKTWLRNMCIIKEFDKAYKTDQKVMSIYMDLSIRFHDLSIDSIRKVIRDRGLHEV